MGGSHWCGPREGDKFGLMWRCMDLEKEESVKW